MLDKVLNGIFGEKIATKLMEQLVSKKLVGLTVTIVAIAVIGWRVAEQEIDYPYYVQMFDLAKWLIVCITIIGCVHQVAQFRLDKLDKEVDEPVEPPAPPVTPNP